MPLTTTTLTPILLAITCFIDTGYIDNYRPIIKVSNNRSNSTDRWVYLEDAKSFGESSHSFLHCECETGAAICVDDFFLITASHVWKLLFVHKLVTTTRGTLYDWPTAWAC